MEFFTLKSEAKKVTACTLIQELPPTVVKFSKEAILQAASEGKTFVNIDHLATPVAGKLATMYKMLDFQTEVIVDYGLPRVTIKWED